MMNDRALWMLLAVVMVAGGAMSVLSDHATREPQTSGLMRVASDVALARLTGRQTPCTDMIEYWECHSSTQRCTDNWTPPVGAVNPCPTTVLNPPPPTCVAGFKCTTEQQPCWVELTPPTLNDACFSTPLKTDECHFDNFSPCRTVGQNGCCTSTVVDVRCLCLCLGYTSVDVGTYCRCKDPT